MKKWKSIVIYRIVAIISFLILLVVQFLLVYNTYRLKDQHYFFSAKRIINDAYSRSITNDKVYPGGQNVVDPFIYNNMSRLESLNKKSPAAFKHLGSKVCDSIVTELRKNSNMDSLFAQIVKQNKLGQDLQYALTITSIGVTFSNNHYLPLFRIGNQSVYPDKNMESSEGIIIDGNLKNLNAQTLVTSLSVSSPLDHSYRIGFSLYVDTANRYIEVLKQMIPMLLLAVFSILLVVLIYFFTFKNWLKQKKLTEMQSDFVNSITHELHTPLATIIIANKNLQNDRINSGKENIIPLTKIIERQSQRLKTLFARILGITTMNKFTLNKEEYVLGQLLDDVLLDYRLMLSDDNIILVFNKNGVDRKLLLDRFWFTTMVFNIFENAIKYNNSSVKKVEITLSDTKEATEIHIKDNGVGMAATTVNHIFEKFYRDTNNELKDTNGLGLGLFYTAQSIKAHGWKIKVASQEKEGSTFIIIIYKKKFNDFNK